METYKVKNLRKVISKYGQYNLILIAEKPIYPTTNKFDKDKAEHEQSDNNYYEKKITSNTALKLLTSSKIGKNLKNV